MRDDQLDGADVDAQGHRSSPLVGSGFAEIDEKLPIKLALFLSPQPRPEHL